MKKQRMKKRIWVTCLCMTVLSPMTLSAQEDKSEDKDYTRGWYIGAQAGMPMAEADFSSFGADKFSLNELYVASTAYEPGSDEFNLIFETAVKMYPMDPIANLNAASVAISTKDFKKAEKYLVRAGDSSYVIYTWGLYHMATGDYETAIFKMQNAYEGGIPEAAEMLRQCEKLAHYHKYNN